MQRLARLYVSHFGVPTAWYDHLLFDLEDPDTHQPTDCVFNLENAGGKTSLLAYLFSCFDPRQERWLQHLQKRSHRFSEYFSRDGRPSFIAMEWKVPARIASTAEERLIIGQAVSLRDSPERGADIERWFFAFAVSQDLNLETLPAPGFTTAPVRTMHELVQWMHQAAKRSNGDFYHTKTQEDWVKHLGNARLLDIELLRMQVDFNSNEGGMEEGFLTFNSELDLLRRFLALTLDATKGAMVRDAVAKTADTLRAKPKYEKRLEHLTRLQTLMLPFAESASSYLNARETHETRRRTLAGLAQALVRRREQRHELAQQRDKDARTQEGIAKTSQASARGLGDENMSLEGMLLERAMNAARTHKAEQQESLRRAQHRLRCLEAAQALGHIEATRTRQEELEALVASQKEELDPIREHTEIQGALLRAALRHTEEDLLTRKARAGQAEATARSALEGVQRERMGQEQRIREFADERGQLESFMDMHLRQREHLLQEDILLYTDASASAAIGRLERQLEERRLELESLESAEAEAREAERTERDRAAEATLAAEQAQARQDPQRRFLAAGEAVRDELRQSPILRTAADTDQPDPDAPPLVEALNRLIEDADREIAERNVRLAQLQLDRNSILETGLAGRNPNIDAVVRALHAEGIRSARPANTYLAEVRPEAADARALVVSDPARFLGVTVAQGEWSAASQLARTLTLRLTAPVKIAVSSLMPGAQDADAIVLPAQDDAAYNKPAAQGLRAQLDVRITDTQDALRAYAERRNEGTTIRERLLDYLKNYGATRLRQAQAALEEHLAAESAARERAAGHRADADRLRSHAQTLRPKLAELPKHIARIETGLNRLQAFVRDFESALDEKRGRLEVLRGLLETAQRRIEELDQQRAELEKAKESAFTEQTTLKSEADTLAREARQILHFDEKFPADEQLRARPRELETLRVTYADAVATLQTEERQRLGVLSVKLDQARRDLQQAQEAFAKKFSDLPPALLEPLKTLDFDAELRAQDSAVTEATAADRTAENALTEATTAHRLFWQNKRQMSAQPEHSRLTDAEARTRMLDNKLQIEHLTALAGRAADEAARAQREAQSAATEVAQLNMLHETLRAAVPLSGVEPIAVVLPEGFEAYTTQGIADFQAEQSTLQALQQTAAARFRDVTRWAGSAELAAVEPELSRDLAESEFDLACTDRARVVSLIADRISATQDTLKGMEPDFENCVGEIYNLAHEAIRLLTRACAITMPNPAPYVGGKPILRMKAAIASISAEGRKASIRHYLNGLIESGVIPAKGADLIANGLLAISGRADLGLELLKMEQNEAYQYQLASELKGSKGQGSVIAMFLYLLISQLRADMQARAKRGGGGPLILDNPFAKVQTRALVDAQRLLAKEIGVQLIFFTANADYNMLAGFRRVIRLRKAGAHSRSGRSHLEMVSAAITDLPAADQAASA